MHRLEALDAFNQKLVKKIAVRGIQTRGLAGTNAYLYLEGIDISKQAPVARIELEVKLKSGEIKRQLRRLRFRDDLFIASGELDQYQGFTISQIDAVTDTVEFTNGEVLKVGEANGDVSESDIRRIQIRETIKAHLDKEKQLFAQGVKVLSLFFIDEVVKYRDYAQADEKGEYACSPPARPAMISPAPRRSSRTMSTTTPSSTPMLSGTSSTTWRRARK
ncbi:hypothetical protein [Halochromatium glycolicum]|uniref:hypothetical protein n=1 Tax=Halochromatium glycolicum TaxID=85075 RepID=UPI001F5B6552|nr:hypothetical protein [Halochromatium glycolicum]